MEYMYITNDPAVAAVAERNGVGRLWVDLETRGKEDRQKNLDTVKSHHSAEDISRLRNVLTTSELMVRVNPLYARTKQEVDDAIARGANVLMLPMFYTKDEAKRFVDIVGGRAKCVLLVETPQAAKEILEIQALDGVDELHVGLNDLHLAYGMRFMYELLANGEVERICNALRQSGKPYGFGGIARLHEGTLPAKHILAEHYRLGSTRVILSRSFCNTAHCANLDEVAQIFDSGMRELREYEKLLQNKDEAFFADNQTKVRQEVAAIVRTIASKAPETNCTPFMTELNVLRVEKLREKYGDAFYLLESRQFRQNYKELSEAFGKEYPKFNIAYSYKTNYTPKLCRIVNELGGFAEVVSDMEAEIAHRVGVPAERILWNGPYKNSQALERLLCDGVTVNLDSEYETELVKKIASKHRDKTLSVGIRCNTDIGDGVISRFGFDVAGDAFKKALNLTQTESNIKLAGLQCHFATRRLETWQTRTEKMLQLTDALGIVPAHLDLGGGLFGKMPPSLKAQFDSAIPSYVEYAQAAAKQVAAHYARLPLNKKPLLLIEPGSALVGDCMRFVSRVENIKHVRGKAIATVLGSIYNINPTLNKKNPPLAVVRAGSDPSYYADLDFGGFTCIESDYLYRHYQGDLAVGDYVVFGNVGSYSVVLKPPFILPNFPVLEICDEKVEVIKQGETFEDVFHTYVF